MFCFFKQKTAYEMRISDWSSDVCSSDLSIVAMPVGNRIMVAANGTHAGGAKLEHARRRGRLERRRTQRGDIEPLLEIGRIFDGDVWHQTGRASCRERVCQ